MIVAARIWPTAPGIAIPRTAMRSRVENGCSGKTSFLIVGTFGSEEWLHSTHGTKIIRAVELKKEGAPLAIISERAWTETL